MTLLLATNRRQRCPACVQFLLLLLSLLVVLQKTEGSSRRSSSNGNNNLVRGARATLGSTADYWKQTLHKVTKPLQTAAVTTTTTMTNMMMATTPPATGFIRIFKSKEKKQQEALLQALKTMPIKQVTVPNSTVLPAEVIHLAAKRAGVLGNPLRTDRVQEFAATVKRWYTRQGYILHSVTGATLLADTATAEIQVQEPILSQQPVDITFCKELVVDAETGNLLSFRQYKDMHKTRRTLGYDKITKKDVNTTLVETQGRTKSSRIAQALGLHAGQPFQWNAGKWSRIANSPIFTRILRATPTPQNDGTIQLQMVVQEAPSRHLEYGLGKSLYTGTWEGELDFAHDNLLGGGEHLGLSIRRGTQDVEPSIRVQFRNDLFGMSGGYDIEAFSDYIGGDDSNNEDDAATTTSAKKTRKGGWFQKGDGDGGLEEASSTIVATASTTQEEEAQEKSSSLLSRTTATTKPAAIVVDYDDDPLLSRRGATFRLRNPFDTSVIRNSVVSASVERTMTKTGLHEDIGSTRVSVGPFVKELPMDARSNIDFQVTTGARVTNGNLVVDLSLDDELRVAASSTAYKIRPYASLTATTKQVFPLVPTSTADRRPVILALRHSVTTSTKTVPRYEAKSIGVANNIRGSSCNGAISSALRGTSELRVPLDIPLKKISQQDLSVVLFHDWIVGAKDTTSPIFRKSSVGLGFRKSFQGLPLQYNLCYCNDGKIKTTFGLGRDFDV